MVFVLSSQLANRKILWHYPVVAAVLMLAGLAVTRVPGGPGDRPRVYSTAPWTIYLERVEKALAERNWSTATGAWLLDLEWLP